MSFSQSFAPPPPPPAPPPSLDIRSLSFARWKELTSATFHMRGENMQRLDRAMETYLADKTNVDALDDLRETFKAWAAHKYRQKGRVMVYPRDFQQPVSQQLWYDEPRNARGAMTALFDLLFSPRLLRMEAGALRMEPEERAAIVWWKGEIDKRAYAIFKGQRMEFRLFAPGAPEVRISQADDYPDIRRKLAALPGPAPAAPPAAPTHAARAPGAIAARIDFGLAVANAGASVAANVSALAHGPAELAGKIQDVILALAGTSNRDVAQLILAAMGLPSVAEIAGRMAPGLGPAISLISGTKEVAHAISTHRAANRIRGRQEHFRDGAARAAVRGIGTLLDEEAKAAGKLGGLHVVSGGLAIGLLFADGGAVSGPALGMAQLLAELLMTAADYVDAWKHREAMNAYLDSLDGTGSIDVGPALFERSPLLGAYFLLIAETSTIIAFSLDRINHPGVMQEIEGIIREDLPEVLEKAAYLVATSPLVVPGLLGHRLHLEKTRATRLREAAGSPQGVVQQFFARLASVACFRGAIGTTPPSNPRYVGFSSDQYFADYDARRAQLATR